MQRPEIPGDIRKWGSVGFCRTSKFASGFTPLQPKPLDSIVDVERLKDRYPDDIASIWDDASLSFSGYLLLNYHYHLGRGHIGASMKAKLYNLLEHRASECRYFVIPVWRGSGYTTMFVQDAYSFFSCSADATHSFYGPYFTVTFYKEFAETKDLVLIRGDVVFTSKLIDSEVEWLIETVQSFYLNDARCKLVERFNKETHDFEFKDVLQALNMPIL
ncbi:hypothetical protein AAHE18_13G286000 [Arachis hypogaea]